MTASTSAAELLQRKHALEGSPDPFPAITDTPPAPKASRSPNGAPKLDTESQASFPSLGTPASSKQPVSASPWSSASPRIKATVSRTPVVSETLTLSAIDLSSAGRGPVTLGDVMKNITLKFKVKVEASSQKKTGQTTFFLKGESERDVEKAKRSLIASLSPAVTVTIEAPVSTIPFIIGTKGVNLKAIRDQTSTKIDIPRRDTLAPPNGNGNSESSTRAPTPSADDDDEPTTTISISGPASLAQEARSMIEGIIAGKRAKTTQRVKDIPAHILPFILKRQDEVRATAGDDADVSLAFDLVQREISVIGDREGVVKVIETIKASVNSLGSLLSQVKISLPKRQHHLLAGSGADHIFGKTKCVVEVTKDASDEIAVWGLPADLGAALGAIMEQAHSQHTASYDIPSPASQIFAYLDHINFVKTLSDTHLGVRINTPKSHAAGDRISIDFAGEKSAVDAAIKQLGELVQKVKTATREVEIDWLLHKIVQGKSSKKIKHFHDTQHVQVFFPAESAESSKVLLVYDPSEAGTAAQHKKNLEAVKAELLKLAQEAGTVKTETVSVEKKWHSAVVGKGGSTLNALIGEEKALSIKVGAEAKADSVDVIVLRGSASDVDVAHKEILRIVEMAKNDEIDSGFSLEFEINRDYVGRIVGSQGSGVNKLRDQLDVKIDFQDDEKDTVKKGKAVAVLSKVKITGRKANVEDAKKRILSQVDKLADETSETLKIPRQFHPSLIGPAGKYVIRLEDKYSVKITFPRDSDDQGGKTRETLNPNEVLIKGGKKGVAEAKAEILDALAFEKESNVSLEFTVPTRAIARVLGKSGAVINEIKDKTNASKIDIEKDDTSPESRITIRGTKEAIAEAKALILEIASQVEDEVIVTVHVESKFHRNLIGAGGQGLKDLVAKCGGPSDSRAQAGLIHFPRQGESADEVRLRGEPKLVAKLKVELEKIVNAMRDRIVLLVAIPVAQHRTLIGRGGQHLTDLQNKTGAQIQFPGSRSYAQVGEAENAEEFKDVDPATLVKVIGAKAACEQAIKSMQAIKPPPASAPPSEAITATVNVPLKYFNTVSQQGAFFRQLRSLGVHVDHSATPQKSTPSRPAETARIDDEVDPNEVQWQVVANYQDAEEGDSEWTLKARDQAGLDEAQKLLATALEHAANATHVGYLTLPDRNAFPRIVGTKGSTVSRLRAETGADITVGRDDNTIVIIGTESSLQAAKDAIATIAAPRPRRDRDYDH